MNRHVFASTIVILLLAFAAPHAQSADPELFPQMVPDQYMESGFHPLVDERSFPKEMRDAISNYKQVINDSDVDALFELRTFTGSRSFDGETTLDYQIMYPPADAVAPPGGFPLVFTTYGRERIAEAMTIDAFREKYPAYVVSFMNTKRPGPLHAPPVHSDYAFLFLEVFEWLFEEYPIDRDRVYGSGWSRGGSSMTILSHAYHSLHPDKPPLIAAMVPSAGGFQSLEENAVESIKNVKIFSLQSASDGNSNPHGSIDAFDALEKAGALDNIFWWVADAGHSPHRLGWNVAEVIDWMFAQTRADLPLRPNAVLDIDSVDAGVPLTFSANAAASTGHNGTAIVNYSWQIFQSQRRIAEYSNRYLHGYELEMGFQDHPVISSDPSLEYTINDPGTYWLRVIVEDADGRRRAVTQEIHARSVEPTAAFSFSRNHEVIGQAVLFDASASVAEYQATIDSYHWDFGDGNTATGLEVSHAYASAGEHSVTLTVTSSEGVINATTSTVTVTESFPGYRYFRFRGLDNQLMHQSPRIAELAFVHGSNEFPPEPMTSSNSHGISLQATWNEDRAYLVFDKDPDTSWSHHSYRLPGTLLMDVGDNQRFVPTGLRGQLWHRNSRWSYFIIEASVNKDHWDHLWTHNESIDGVISSSGVTITFPEVPSLEMHNIESGVYGLGREFTLQANVFNMGNVSEVRYYANGHLIGSSSQPDNYEVLWTPSALGDYALTAVADYGPGQQQATWFAIDITIDPAPVISDIVIIPDLLRVYPSDSIEFSATAYDQYGNALIPQPQLTWSVAENGGSINAAGEYTAGTTFGTFAISASATYQDSSLQRSILIQVADVDNHCVEYFAGDSLRDIWEFIRKEPWKGSRADVSRGIVTIQSRGERMWQQDNFFSGIRRRDITGDFDLSVKVVSQNDVHHGSKVGIVVANDLDDLSQGGYATLHTRGNRRVMFQREGSTLGQFGSSSSTDSDDAEEWWPVWLRLVKSGTEFATYYKFAEGDEWIHLATDTVSAAAEDVEIALFSSSNDSSATVYGVFTDFIQADCEQGPAPIIDQQPNGAHLEAGSHHTLTVLASGEGPLSYQWFKGESAIAGATEESMDFAPIYRGDAGNYRVTVSNAYGTVSSDTIAIHVSAQPLILHTAPSSNDILHGQMLSQVELTGGEVHNSATEVVAGTYTMVNGSHIPPEGTADYAAIFSPTDSRLYEPLEFLLTITVYPARRIIMQPIVTTWVSWVWTSDVGEVSYHNDTTVIEQLSPASSTLLRVYAEDG